MYTGTCHRLLISVSVAPIDTPNRHLGGWRRWGSFYFFPADSAPVEMEGQAAPAPKAGPAGLEGQADKAARAAVAALSL